MLRTTTRTASSSITPTASRLRGPATRGLNPPFRTDATAGRAGRNLFAGGDQTFWGAIIASCITSIRDIENWWPRVLRRKAILQRRRLKLQAMKTVARIATTVPQRSLAADPSKATRTRTTVVATPTMCRRAENHPHEATSGQGTSSIGDRLPRPRIRKSVALRFRRGGNGVATLPWLPMAIDTATDIPPSLGKLPERKAAAQQAPWQHRIPRRLFLTRFHYRNHQRRFPFHNTKNKKTRRLPDRRFLKTIPRPLPFPPPLPSGLCRPTVGTTRELLLQRDPTNLGSEMSSSGETAGSRWNWCCRKDVATMASITTTTSSKMILRNQTKYITTDAPTSSFWRDAFHLSLHTFIDINLR